MIHLPLKHNEESPDILQRPQALKQIRQAINNANGDLCTSHYYRHKVVLDKLKAFSIHKQKLEDGDSAKCYYCESYSEDTSPLQVEHYRPRNKTDIRDTEGVEHSGYFWLGLEWTNLLLSCSNCNGKGGKSIRFPIRGIRAQPVDPVSLKEGKFVLNTDLINAKLALLTEDPVLLNPEIDMPQDYLTFGTNGIITEKQGKDPERGRMTISICKLDRPLLKAARLKIWDESKRRCLQWVIKFQNRDYNENVLFSLFKDECKLIIQRKQPFMDHSLWGTYLNENIELFSRELHDDTCIEIFRRAYISAVSDCLS